MREPYPTAMTSMSKHTKALLVILFAAAVIRFVIVLNLPILFIANAGHDDGLYMRLATTLASGNWLGEFSQFTLMKGPGYPIFLAVTSLSGLPASATHALFQIAAIAVTAWAAYRLTASRATAALMFLTLIFYPVGFMPELQRVFRDQIYWAQTLLIFTLFTILFFTPPRGRSAAIFVAGLAGLILGWAWLTREEGDWFIPGTRTADRRSHPDPSKRKIRVARSRAEFLHRSGRLYCSERGLHDRKSDRLWIVRRRRF